MLLQAANGGLKAHSVIILTTLEFPMHFGAEIAFLQMNIFFDFT
jgi:hypothetical protein